MKIAAGDAAKWEGACGSAGEVVCSALADMVGVWSKYRSSHDTFISMVSRGTTVVADHSGMVAEVVPVWCMRACIVL